MTDVDLDRIEEDLADLLADGAKSKLWRTADVVALVARVREAEAERDELRELLDGRFNHSPHQAPKYWRRAREAERERDELRATVARVEALADWHDTSAWLNGIGSRDASRIHWDAATRLRKALEGDQP